MRYVSRFTLFIFLFFVVTVSFSVNNRVSAAGPMTVPAGFTDETVYGGLLAPRAFTFLPDGRVLVLERGSATSNDINLASIRVFKNGTLLPTRAWTVNTCGDSERGLLGIVPDPQFTANGYIYVYYTRWATSGDICGYSSFANGNVGGTRNRISRLTLSGDTVVAGSEKILIDSIISEIGYHNAGDIKFGSDGYLYASTGNGGRTDASPSTGVLSGKILRIKPDNSALGYNTAGNPYDATGVNCNAPYATNFKSTPCKEIFAKGLRNPFRFAIEPSMSGIPGAGQPFVGDVGDGAWEEVDLVRNGGDYGYPVREGPCPAGVLCSPPYQTGGYDNPVYSYPHVNVNSNFDSAVIGGDFYTGGASYPSDYNNDYFFAEFARGFIGRLKYNASSGQWERTAQDFATGGDGLIGVQRGPDGNLYYITYTSDTDRVDGVHRIRYTASSNQAPNAQASVNPQAGPLNTTYTFSAEGSSDPDGNTPLKYHWDFGDGTSTDTTNLTVTHVYSQAVDRTATLTVTDSGTPPATSSPATVNVYPGNTPPSGSIVLTNLTDNSRTASLTFYAGDQWAYSAANLSDDEALPADAVTWEIVFHHEQHTHPFIPFADGNSGQFTIPNTGELDPVVWYRVHMYITDARGQRTEVIKDVNPITSNLTFNTNPSGGQVTIEGASFPTPLNLTRVVGMRFSVDVPSPQSIGPSSYTFSTWSQGGTQQQTITVPPTDTTYTANLNTIAATPTLSPTPTPVPGQGQNVTLQVNSAWDDANEVSGTVTGTTPTVWVGNAGNNASYLGLRFTNVAIPKGASITSANLQFYSSQSQWISMSADIAGEASANAQPFNAGAISTRTLTTTHVTHTSNVQWLANTWYSFNDVKSVVQEVINLPAWNAGGNLALIIRGTGGTWSRKFLNAFDGTPANAPRLVIAYTNGGAPQPSPSPAPTPTATFTLAPSSTPIGAPSPTATLRPSSTPTFPPTWTPTPTATLTPTPLAGSGTFTRQIVAGGDDVNQDGSTFQSNLNPAWIGAASSAPTSFSGFRFTGVQIPRGATITSAWLEFYSTTSQWLTISLQIAGDASDNSLAFSASALPSQRTLTTARVPHTSNVNWAANTWYQFTDMKAVVQEIINRPNWQSGNAVSIIFTGMGGAWGRKFIAPFEKGAAFAPRLVINYTS